MVGATAKKNAVPMIDQRHEQRAGDQQFGDFSDGRPRPASP